MRELRVVGLEPDAKHVVLADPASGDKFRIPVDDTLRAASRGDLARLGQIQIETASQLRPREIQARIRAGASVEQVAEEAGIPVSKVERFAYPVLLERSRAAEMAQHGHPVRPDGPTVQTLLETVTQAFRARSHNLDVASWDAWRDDDGHWVVQLQWHAGRSTNTAHWRYQPDAHGGTIVALDDVAADLVDPDCGRPLRYLTPVYSARDVDDSTETEPAGRYIVSTETVTIDQPVAETDTETRSDTETEAEPAASSTEPAETAEPASDPAADDSAPKRAAAHAPGKDKRGKPALPSWDDVLLGVRSNGRG
ncbi:septation protein SepH [Rhodococcus chondri]|uniref:Septation protein SepH n=1 Tax=Rhodococcus chondri TaxID=3065941 RepID=A0ABU7JT57_9NOCA|nr:septation protein SepH [Rhodococcus sp. CC-R104]MEE2033213.1 septation protein SepH [Rhodococcus sp. CC-R104]